MGDGGKLGAEHLADVLNELGCDRPEATDEVRRHIAALEADNAAHVDLWKERGCLDLGPTVDSQNPSSCIEQGWPLERHGSCPACRALGRPHPGTALLEEHRKALLAVEVRYNTTWSTMHVREEEHRKALVRARNEGREQAAKMADMYFRGDRMAERRDTAAGIAKDIRAMMEPEQ
jgi:hypothetical protein